MTFVLYEFKKKPCKDCGKDYMPKSGRQIRCVKCAAELHINMIKSGYFNAPRARKNAAKSKGRKTKQDFDY